MRFFDLLRSSKDRLATPLEMEGFDPEPPKLPETEYLLDPPMIMPDIPQANGDQRPPLEGVDRGIQLPDDLEPGTDIPEERTKALNENAKNERTAQLRRRIVQMKEDALDRAQGMDAESLKDYFESLEQQAQDAQDRVQDLLEGGQGELAEVEKGEVEVFRAQAEEVRELLDIRQKINLNHKAL